MPFNPYDPETEQERADNARTWTLAEVNKGACPAGTAAHHTKIRPASGQYVAVCTCGWRQTGACYTPGIAQAEANRHRRAAA